MIAAVKSAASCLQPETLVSLESTTYPGTTDDVVRPILGTSGLVTEVDLNLAFSWERIDSGKYEFGPRNGKDDRRSRREMLPGDDRFLADLFKRSGTRDRMTENLSPHQHCTG